MRLLLLVLLAAPAGAVWTDTGGSAMQFLRVTPGARALALGEAYGPVAVGAEAMYWNPAGLARLGRPDFSYSHAEMLGLLRHDHAAFSAPFHRIGGAWGLAASFFHQDSIPLVTNTDQTIGSFAPHGEALALGYARRLFVGEDNPAEDRSFFQDLWRHPGAPEPLDHEPEPWTGSLAVGGAFKFASETIYDESAWAVALDVGANFRPVDLPEMSMSATLRNLGTHPRFRGESEPLPLEAAVGVAYAAELDGHRLLPAFEVAVPAQGKPYGKLGLEYSLPVAGDWRASIRAGYKSLAAYDLGPLAGLAGGVGFSGSCLSVDFAFTPMGALGEVFRGSFGWRFETPDMIPRERHSGKRIDGRIRPIAPGRPEKPGKPGKPEPAPRRPDDRRRY